MHYTCLSERKLIEISGDEAAVFLQGLVSNDVTRLRESSGVYAALLTPQGKFLHDFFLMKRGNTILIDCAAASLSDLLSRLSMYKLRSKVTIAAMPENTGVVAVWGNDSDLRNPQFMMFPDPRLAQLGWRIAGDVAAIESWCAGQKMERKSSEDYDLMRLELGIPDGARDMIREKSLLLEFAFEDLNGVDFKKGCYVGQEVTARSKYRGQVRKFIYQVHATNGALPPFGAAVTLDGEAAGELRSSHGSVGLAVLNVAMVEKALAGDTYFHAGETTCKAALPTWVTHPPKALTLAE